MIQKNTDLRQLIKSQHIPQTKLALALNISPTTLMRWLDLTVTEGKRVMILAAIAKVAGRKATPCKTPEAPVKKHLVVSLYKMRKDMERRGDTESSIKESERIWAKHEGKPVYFYESDCGWIMGSEPRVQVRRAWCEEGF